MFKRIEGDVVTNAFKLVGISKYSVGCYKSSYQKLYIMAPVKGEPNNLVQFIKSAVVSAATPVSNGTSMKPD